MKLRVENGICFPRELFGVNKLDQFASRRWETQKQKETFRANVSDATRHLIKVLPFLKLRIKVSNICGKLSLPSLFYDSLAQTHPSVKSSEVFI